MHSVLLLVLSFINVSGRMMLIQAEYMGLIFRVVYVGAIAVRFLFVIMMLNLSSSNDNMRGSVIAMSIIRSIGVVVLFRIYGEMSTNVFAYSQEPVVEWEMVIDQINNIETIGQVRYTYRLVYVLMAGGVLLVAIIGSIVLTLKVRQFAMMKRQQVHQQRSRDVDNAIAHVRRI